MTILLIHPTQKGHTCPTCFLGYSETLVIMMNMKINTSFVDIDIEEKWEAIRADHRNQFLYWILFMTLYINITKVFLLPKKNPETRAWYKLRYMH